ncbi:LacI family transcriptional regulator [Deinococcus cellulosilyticus NBRC 106333 = KACC 11606]|uniref:LacI family transcriptional regulator n=2 Tax=Deinococcus cellulosilyticus TaxID=401558 RepID=A0A511MWB0_DEIC1|nr:LacI family transcriptional regulator [Deinococcus cellulosilyticus NBRC 106333 = KACC 11606]
MVTLVEVAQEAGVSPSTVSRILSGTANVSLRKRHAVEEAIRKLNYQPNIIAKGLVRGQTMSIGVLTQDISSPFYNDALLGVQEALQGTDYVPVFVDGHWHPKDEETAIGRLMGRVDGLIIMGGSLAEDTLKRLADNMPIIAIGRKVPDQEHHSLILDNYSATRKLMDFLFELGHVRIAHIAGPRDHPDAIERLHGYRDALEAAGHEVSPNLIVEGDYHESAGLLAVATLLESRTMFTAIFAANDQMAYGARLALYRRGIRVPEEVSLVGFDDAKTSEYFSPPLTTVRQPMHELGRQAAEALLQMIEGAEVRLEAPELQLVIRESTKRIR